MSELEGASDPAAPVEMKIVPSDVATLGGEPMVAPAPTVNVTVLTPPPTPATVVKGDGTTLAPTTTEAEDKVTSGQRQTSLLWESVQGFIAVSITLATIYCAVAQISSETIVNAFFFIVATYFTRTNHTKIGGVGPKPYEGR